MADTAKPVARPHRLLWPTTPQGQWHALIDCYGRHRRPQILDVKTKLAQAEHAAAEATANKAWGTRVFHWWIQDVKSRRNAMETKLLQSIREVLRNSRRTIGQ